MRLRKHSREKPYSPTKTKYRCFGCDAVLTGRSKECRYCGYVDSTKARKSGKARNSCSVLTKQDLYQLDGFEEWVTSSVNSIMEQEDKFFLSSILEGL